MQSDKYTITIRVEDQKGAFAETVFQDCPRGSVLDQPIIGNVVRAFEEMETI